jgi:hypothetical protein
MPEWPDWRSWELELSPHLLKRMADRQFTETDLRRMLADARGWRPNCEPGRWVAETSHDRRPWEVIVEPIPEDSVLLVVTAYPAD